MRLPKRFPWKTIERNCQSSFWDTPLNCYILSVPHVTNDVKWRPIVTTFSTLRENLSRTAAIWLPYFVDFFDYFMSNINCGIGVLHVKRQILTYLLWRHFSDRSIFFVSFDRAYKEVSTKKYWIFFYGSVFVIWLYLQKAMYHPCDFDLWKSMFFQWIDNDTISALYEFQIDIFTNSW